MATLHTLHKVQTQQAFQDAHLPDVAIDVLNVLDDLEEFTISIRKKIMNEIRSEKRSIHLKID